MLEFESENIDPFCQQESHQLDISTWDSSELRLKPLASNPFDFFQHDDTTLSEITNSTQTTRSSIHSDFMDEDVWLNATATMTPSNTKCELTWDTMGHNGTSFITEAPTRLFEPIIRQSDADSLVIYEHDLVRHLIQAVYGVPSKYFYWSSNNELKQYRNLRILGVSASCIEQVIERVLSFGTQLKALERLGQRYLTGGYGLTGMAFGSCLVEFHLNIQYTMMNEVDSILTILHLQQWMENLFLIVNRLYRLCQPDLPFGAGILNLLYEEIKPLDLILNGSLGLYRDVCFCFLQYTGTPYLNMLNQWLHLDAAFQELEDPHGEFFIRINKHINEDDVQNRYQIQSDAVLPYFINNELANEVLRSGSNLQLLNKNKPDHALFQLSNALPLSLLLNTNDREEYIQKLNNICELIQIYNDNQTTIVADSNDRENGVYHEKITNNVDVCSIPALNKDILGEKDFSNRLKELVMNHSKKSTASIHTIINQSFIKPLATWCPLLNESLMKSVFLNEHQLEYHLSILYQYYLLGNGLFGNGLEEILLSEMNGHMNLNLALKDLIIENSYQKEEEFIYITLSKDRQTLKLKYTVPYPFNILITKEVIDKYDRIFQFLVEICKLNAMMKKSYELLRGLNYKSKQIHKYRFELSHFISEFTTYIKSSIIESTWHSFIKNLKQDMMHFKEYQDFTLDCILYPCFLKHGQSKVFEVLQPILNDLSMFYKVLLSAQHKQENEAKVELKCRRIFDQFKVHTNIFIKVLSLLETKGSGRLSNIMNSHHKHHHLDVFVKDLIIRLNMNHFHQ